jgi:hypothetical protein
MPKAISVFAAKKKPHFSAANTFTLSGATSGTTSVAVTYTVTPNRFMGATVVVTPAASNGGTVDPATLTFAAGTTQAQTFTVTRASDGTSSVSISNNGGLANSGSPISLTTSSGASVTDDWSSRIAGSGVSWYHNFDTASEVNQFRWSSGYSGGNDPLALGDDGPRVQHIASGGADGGAFLRVTYPLGANTGGSYWYRPFSALTGATNGRGVNDPGAGGTITPATFTVSDGSSTLYTWSSGSAPGWYGSATDVAANPTKYQGTDFYLQVRCRRAQTPGPPPDSGSFTNITGKHVWLTATPGTATAQEIVTYGQSAGEDVVGQQGRHRMYGGFNFAPFGGNSQDNETTTIDNRDGTSDWRWTGGWDTLLYHVTPGPEGGTGSNRGRLEVWAQRDLTQFPAESGRYTKIWDTAYTNHYTSGSNSSGAPYLPGWNALILGIYHNGSQFTTTSFEYDYDQVIFSKGQYITAPVDTSVFPSWYPASAGTIVTVPSSSTTALSAAQANGSSSYPGGAALTAPWSGGALVHLSGQPYLVVKGGGHSDSAYNGMVKFGPLAGSGSNTPTWSLFLTASSLGSVQDAVLYSDGRASATHTYNNLVGIDDAVYEMAMDGRYQTGDSAQNHFRYTSSGATSRAANIRTGQYGAGAYYNGKVYYITGANAFDRLRIYDVAANSWSSEGNADIALGLNIAAAVDTARGKMFVTDGATGVYWDLNTLTRTTGRNAPASFSRSLEYDPHRDAFVSYESGSQTLRELSASSLAAGGNPSWTTRAFTGSTPVSSDPAGTFGRFRYVPALKGYLVAPTQSSSVYFFRSA